MLTPPSRPVRRRLLPALAATVATLLTLAGCAATPSSAAPEEIAQPQCIGSGQALTELELAPDPSDVAGPSTACLLDAHVEAVSTTTEPALPVTVTDVQGTSVTVTDASRILPLDITGAIAATVFGLGLGDQVVGRDGSTGFPEAAHLPVVTADGHTLSAEPIIALAPTVVITDTTLGPRDVIAQLRDAGIPVVIVTKERSIETVGELVAQVAAALGVVDTGAALTARVENEIDATRAEIDAVAPTAVADRPRILFLYVRGSAGVYYLFGEESGADSLIRALDGVDVAGEIGWTGMRPVTAEALIQAAPDVVLLMTKGLESVDGIDGLLTAVPALAATPAGENRRFVDMNDTDILSFGPRSAQVLDALARAIYAPEASGPVVGAAGDSGESSE